MPKPVSVAIMTHAGGAHLGAYFAALRDAAGVDRIVLADPDGSSQAAAGKVLGEKLTATYRSHAEMLAAEKPNLALITMEARLAPPVIRQALEAGCHVFAEKPACVQPEDFAQLKQLADSRHQLLMLAFANRLNPEVLKARELIHKGSIGRVYGLEMHLVADQTRLTRTSYHKSWFAQRSRSGGGHLAWLGIHWIDLSTWLTGARVAQVTGFAGNAGGQPVDIEDSAALALQYDREGSPFLGTLTSGYYLDRGYHSHLRIWGSHGWLELAPTADRKLHWYSSREQPPAEHDWDGNPNPRGYTPFVHAANRAVAEEAEPPVTAHDGLQALRVVHGLYTAAETGKTQVLDVTEQHMPAAPQVPLCRCVPLPQQQLSFQVGTGERLRWHGGSDAPRPFFYPLAGPSGQPLTRMGHPGAPNHDHHRSIWFAHHDVAGVNFWSDQTPARIRQQQWLAYEDGDDEARIAVQLEWTDGHDPAPLLEQQVLCAVRPAGPKEHFDETLVEICTQLKPRAEILELGKTNFGLLAVRVAAGLSEYFGGGRLTSAEGRTGEKAIFGRGSAWMDYSGSVPGRNGSSPVEGITFFDHPANPGFPSRWHVREDGWMGASLTMNGPLTLHRAEPLVLRYLLHAHAGPVQPDRATSIAAEFSSSSRLKVVRSTVRHRTFQVLRDSPEQPPARYASGRRFCSSRGWPPRCSPPPAASVSA